MSIFTLNDHARLQLANAIEALPPRPHHSALLELANRIRAGCAFRYALNRGGWYRQGGVIQADGTRVADNLEQWARTELQNCDGDMAEFVERHADSGLMVTRHSGKTHYFVASYGPSPSEFMQLEVEELQEVLDRSLINAVSVPEDLQELIEPMQPRTLHAQAVAAPHYRFRRLLDMRPTLAGLGHLDAREPGMSRLLSEWGHSRAATRGQFCDHWIVVLREHQDCYGNPTTSVSLVSRHARELKPFQWNAELTGVDMSVQLQSFDRSAGYPGAWYFHLVAGTVTPSKVAYAVARDLESGFNYLADTETALIQGWVSAPYSV